MSPLRRKRRHRAAQLIGLVGGEPGARRWRSASPVPGTAARPGSCPARARSSGGRIVDRLHAVAAAQIGMDHVALDRPGPDDRDLDHQIVEFFGLEPRQHAHLGAALDLEHADRIGLATACRRPRVARPGSSASVIGARRVAARSGRTPCGCRSACRAPACRSSACSSASRSSLSHSMTVRSSIAAFSIGTSSSSGPRVMTKPPTCCDRWRGKPISAPASSSARRRSRSAGSSPASRTRSSRSRSLVPAPHHAGQRGDRHRPTGPAPCRPRGSRRAGDR